MNLSAFSVFLNLLQAQSLVDVVTSDLPSDFKYDKLCQASMKIVDCSSELTSLYNESELL